MPKLPVASEFRDCGQINPEMNSKEGKYALGYDFGPWLFASIVSKLWQDKAAHLMVIRKQKERKALEAQYFLQNTSPVHYVFHLGLTS